MKDIAKTLILGVGMLSMVSCSDFLDQSSPSELTKENVFNSVLYTEQALNKVYADLTYDHAYGCRIPLNFGFNTDIELVDALKDTEVSQGTERGLGNYNPSSTWNQLDNNWKICFGIIENANIVVDGIRNSALNVDGSPNQKIMQRFLGEALTMRAMVYYDLVKNYGDLPMKFEPTKTDGSNIYLTKSDRDLILDHLMDDLEEAAGYLPWVGESNYTSEHATAGFAHGLLARIALSCAGYSIRESAKAGYETLLGSDGTYPTQRPGVAEREELYKRALKHLDIVIAKGVHRLNPSFENQWLLQNQRTLDAQFQENIYEVAHGLSKSGEMGYTIGVRISGASSYYGAKGNSSGKVKLTAPFMMSYDPKDLRRDITCATYELKETDGVIKENMQKNQPFSIYVAKWDIRKMDEGILAAMRATDQKWNPGINWIVMRYSDVLLMYAEVMNELYGADGANPEGTCGMSARKALEEVHCRAFSDSQKAAAADYVAGIPSGKDFFEAVVQERAWELAGECIRKYDLIRWGLLSEKIEQFKADYRALTVTAPKFILYKMKKEDPNSIDMSSIQWYEIPFTKEDGSEIENEEDLKKVIKDNTEYADYLYVAGWGTYPTGKNDKDGVFIPDGKTSNDTNLEYLENISGGLNKTVKNRHLLPLGSATISDSNGTLQNSYNF